MLGWLSSDPLTTKELLKNTDEARIKRAQKQIKIISNKQEFIIKKLSLFKRIVSFFSRDPVNTVFIKFTVLTQNTENNHKHYVVLVVPYLKDMSLYKLSNLPIKVYSTTADFKYRFAWEINQSNNIYTDASITKKLGVALTTKPTKVRPLGVPMLDKHLYAVISNIDKLQVKM